MPLTRGPSRSGLTRRDGVMHSREPYPNVDVVLREMVRLANEYKSDPRLRDRVQGVTSGVRLADRSAVARAVWRWVRENVRYVRDPAQTELLQSPVRILESPRYADCDGMATLAAAMLSALGIRAGFRAVARETAGAYDHVYAVYKPSPHASQWHAVDPTAPIPPGPDKQLSQAKSSKTVPLSDMYDESGSELSARSTSSRESGGLTTVGSNPARRDMGSYPPMSQDDSQTQASTTSSGSSGGSGGQAVGIIETLIKQAGNVAGDIWGNGGGGNGGGGGGSGGGSTQPVVVQPQQSKILGMSPSTLAVVGIGGLGVAFVASQFMNDDS